MKWNNYQNIRRLYEMLEVLNKISIQIADLNSKIDMVIKKCKDEDDG